MSFSSFSILDRELRSFSEEPKVAVMLVAKKSVRKKFHYRCATYINIKVLVNRLYSGCHWGGVVPTYIDQLNRGEIIVKLKLHKLDS